MIRQIMKDPMFLGMKSEEASKADMETAEDIREPLFDFLEETYGKIRILEEKMMGRSRAERGTYDRKIDSGVWC